MKLKFIAKLIDKKQVRNVAVKLIEKGRTQEEAIEEISETIDELLDFTEIIPNEPVGEMVEAIDGVFIRFIVGMIVRSLKK